MRCGILLNVDLNVLKRHRVLVSSDTVFRRRARLLQALWREDQGIPIGIHKCQPLGSRIAMPFAEEALANYLTDNIRDVVRREVLDPVRSKGKLFRAPRIFDDLLSSQPLCFNLFGELSLDLPFASAVIATLTGGRVHRVTAIEFEYSPGRGDTRYTSDKSAFDVFVEYLDAGGLRGFLGIEVKYSEDLKQKPGQHRPRYEQVAKAMGAFVDPEAAELRAAPLQQVWRDHLLAGSLLVRGDYDLGAFVFLYPRDNAECHAAVTRYRTHLSSEATFAAWTLEEVVGALKAAGAGPWVQSFEARYLDWGRLSR
jgi:hypothetical protein